jgi:pimeloyl-ACP methyl ester carboxylesterase
VTGEEDVMTGTPEAEFMHQNIYGSQMKVIPKAGHYSAWERPEEVGLMLRKFFDSVYGE